MSESTTGGSGPARSLRPDSAERLTGRRWLAVVLALAVANHVAGRLGLLLAIPPGFVTAIFPPSGIALAALLVCGLRVWPGVFLGSVSFNLHVLLGSTPETSWLGALPVASSIAFGSTLQAAAGWAAIRSVSQAPTALVFERDVLAFLLLGGLASCTIAPSWGVATLYFADLFGGGALAFSWFTWWVGDAIGVLIFTPLVLGLFGRPRSFWRPRLLSVGAPLCIAFTLVVTVYVVVSESEESSIASRFRRRVEVLDRALYRDLRAHAEVLWSIRSYFAGSQLVDQEEFRTFVARSLSAYPGVQALSWNPRVRGAERDAYEARMSAHLGRDFTIRESDESGELVRARPGEEYVVVQYIEPRRDNEAAIGFDVMGDPDRRRALEIARDTGQPSASKRIELVQDPDGDYGFLLFLPIYSSDVTPPTLAGRHEQLLGFTVAAVRVDALVEAAVADLPTDGMVVSLWDQAAPPSERLLGRVPSDPGLWEPSRLASEHEVTTAHEVGGRPWALRFTPTREYIAAQPSWAAWMVLAGGLTFTGLLGAFLLVVTGRAALEAERVAEVAAVNQQLKMTNEELARFAYAASHDLKSPLRGIGQLVDFLIRDHAEALPQDARNHLAMIRVRTHRMSKLLQDLLHFSRVGWLQEKPEPVDTAELVTEIVSLTAESERFEIALRELPEILTFRVPLMQVLRNLVGNAIKHHDRESGSIEVGCRDEGDRYVFHVHDDGPGIPPEHQQRVFEMFQTLRPRDEVEGSGMGLALVRKIVANRGGEVGIESDGRRGTTIRFSWPKVGEPTPEAAPADAAPGERATD